MDLIGYVDGNYVVVTASNTPDLLGKFFDTAAEYFQEKEEVNPLIAMTDDRLSKIKGDIFRFDCGSAKGCQDFAAYHGIELLSPTQAINKNHLMHEKGIRDRHEEANNLFTIGQIHGIASDDPWDKRSLHEKMNTRAPTGAKSRGDDMMTDDGSFAFDPAVKASLGASLSDNKVDNVVASVIRKVNGDENNAILKMHFGFIKKNIEVNWEGTSITGENFVNLLGELKTSTKYKPFFKAGQAPQFEVEMMDGSSKSVAIMNAEKTILTSIFPNDNTN